MGLRATRACRLEGLRGGRDPAEESVAAGVGVFVDVAWRGRAAGGAGLPLLRGVLRGVLRCVVEGTGTLHRGAEGFAPLRGNRRVRHVVRPEGAQALESPGGVGDLLPRLHQASATTLPRAEILLHGAFSLEGTLLVSPVRRGPDGGDAGRPVGHEVEVAGAVQLHGACRGRVRGHFLDFGGWGLPGLKTLPEFGAPLKRSIWGRPGVCRPAGFCALAQEAPEGAPVRREVLEGLVGGFVRFSGPSGLGLQLVRHVIQAVACVPVKRGRGRFDRSDGFKALPPLHLLGHIVVLTRGGIPKFHSRGTVRLFWLTQFTSLNVPSSVIILEEREREREKRTFLNTRGDHDLVNIVTPFSHCQTPVCFL